MVAHVRLANPNQENVLFARAMGVPAQKPIRSSSPLKNYSPRREFADSVFYHESGEACMRGAFLDQGKLFSYLSPEARVPASHPLRKIRELVRDVLGELNRSLGRLYASEGRPSIPPEQLLSALLLQVFYGIRSE
jgi:hypothetical protein